MKTVQLTILFFIPFFSAFSQENKEQGVLKKHNNEIATDVTPFISQFLFNNNGYGGATPSPYSVLYRRHINKWAIRIGFGGYGRDDESIQNDSIVGNSKQSQFDFKVGVERKEDFAKKWQFFYGLDLYTSSLTNSNDNYNQNSGDKTIYETQRDYVGLSPFFGFRFRLNQRLSITTSANMQFYGYESTDKRMYFPDSSYDMVTKTTGSGSSFNTPTSVFITFSF